MRPGTWLLLADRGGMEARVADRGQGYSGQCRARGRGGLFVSAWIQARAVRGGLPRRTPRQSPKAARAAAPRRARLHR
jgi:hypothetical protein